MTEVVLYTDGACSGNPGPGGWGVVLRWQGKEREMYGGDPLTTNNRMELMAAIQALEALQRPATVNLHTDSKYLLDGITKWIKSWQRNGWLTSARKPVKNDDLWRRLTEAMSRHEVTWLWVKGHAGDPGNERADAGTDQATAGGYADGECAERGADCGHQSDAGKAASGRSTGGPAERRWAFRLSDWRRHEQCAAGGAHRAWAAWQNRASSARHASASELANSAIEGWLCR